MSSRALLDAVLIKLRTDCVVTEFISSRHYLSMDQMLIGTRKQLLQQKGGMYGFTTLIRLKNTIFLK